VRRPLSGFPEISKPKRKFLRESLRFQLSCDIHRGHKKISLNRKKKGDKKTS